MDVNLYPNLPDDLKTVFLGKTISREVVYETEDRMRMLRVGYPFTVGETTYAMFINVPMPEIEDTISQVSVIIFISLEIGRASCRERV